MNEFEHFKAMLVRASIPHEVDKFVEQYKTIEPTTANSIVVYNGPVLENNRTNLGYNNFESIWLFDANGQLIGVGHYE